MPLDMRRLRMPCSRTCCIEATQAIDYYDATMEFGSEAPADASKTTRVLTIMLASEY
jgi:hypothetical protein